MKLTLDKYFYLLFLGLFSWHLVLPISLLGIIDHLTGFALVWIVTAGIYLFRASLKINVSKKAVLITGCDTGFGHALALHLDKLGFRVFAGCLLADCNGEGAAKLKEIGSSTLHVLQMDVTDEDELTKARDKLESLLPADEILWAVVNNAGLAAFGEAECVTMKTYNKLMEVNALGTVRVCKKFIPLLRKSKGRVINMASMMGRLEVPGRSPYCLSKSAVVSFSGCLRHEVRKWGINVIVLEPGNFVGATSILTEEAVKKQSNEMWNFMSQEAREAYKDLFDQQIRAIKMFLKTSGSDKTSVISAFEEALTQQYPQVRYQPMTMYYKTRIFVTTHLPEWIYDAIYHS